MAAPHLDRLLDGGCGWEDRTIELAHGVLDENQVPLVRDHLMTCDSCLAVMADAKRVKHARARLERYSSDVDPEPVPPEIPVREAAGAISILIGHDTAGTSRVGNVIRFLRGALSQPVRDAWQVVAQVFDPVEVGGAGEAISAAAARRIKKRFRFFDTIDVEINIGWSSSSFEFSWRVRPDRNGNLVVFFEDARAGEPLAAVTLENISGKEKARSVSVKDLGFDPEQNAWRLRVTFHLAE